MVPAVSIVYRFRIFLYKRYLQGVPAGTLLTDSTCKVTAASELFFIEGTCWVPAVSDFPHLQVENLSK